MRFVPHLLLALALLLFLSRLVAAVTPAPAPQDLAALPPMAALAPTATTTQATPVVVGAPATTEALPPDTDLRWAVRKETGGQVSLGYVTNQAQPQTFFTCTQLDRDVRFAGLSNHQQYVVREMCNQE